MPFTAAGWMSGAEPTRRALLAAGTMLVPALARAEIVTPVQQLGAVEAPDGLYRPGRLHRVGDDAAWAFTGIAMAAPIAFALPSL